MRNLLNEISESTKKWYREKGETQLYYIKFFTKIGMGKKEKLSSVK